MITSLTKVSHWLPIITRCPVNNMPDVIYVYLTFDQFEELYAVRKELHRLLQGKKMFMEDIAQLMLDRYPTAIEAEVRLLTGRHVVIISRPRNV
jgi:hypothetical protein